MSQQPIEVLLRPAVELYTVALCAATATLCLAAPWALALTPAAGLACGLTLMLLAAQRLRQAWRVLRYRRNIRRLPHYSITSRRIPVSRQHLFLGKGFQWDQRHTHRLMQTYRPEFRTYVDPTPLYQWARRLEARLEFAPRPLQPLARLTRWDSPLNPARPLPPVGGLPRLHGIEPDETDATLPLGERVGHTLVLGATRVGKTRLAELLITQDIRRTNAQGEHEVVIVFDPKGDADLLKRMAVEARRAGRENAFYVFHLGWPDISARYNAVGRFGRISEVATRVAGQLSGEGNSAAFREFAWRFVNIIARALVELGQRPDYQLILRHVVNIDALFMEYAAHFLARTQPKAWDIIVQLEAKLNDKTIPRHMTGREKRVVAIEQYLSQVRVYDPVLDGLRSAVRYDRNYFDKIVASLLPLLEKLTTGKIAPLLAPSYSELNDPRPIFDWMQIVRQRAVVYVGLDALSDTEARIGNRAKAGQVVGNFNNLFMLRVRETATAELLTQQLPKVEVYASSQISTAADSSSLDTGTDFSSTTQERVTATSVPMIEPAYIVSLPKGQCFALVEGGKLRKIRMPLPEPDPDEAMPANLQAMAKEMRLNHITEPDWWQDASQPDAP